MTRQQNQQGSQDDSSNIVLFIAGGVVLLLIWMATYKHLASILFYIRQIELWIPSLVSEQARAVRMALMATNPQHIDMGGFMSAMTDSGKIVAWIFAPLTFALSVLVYLKSPIRRYLKNHDMRSLAEQEKAIWPTISPATFENLSKQSMRKGPWAAAMTEREFAVHHNLLYSIPASPIYALAERAGALTRTKDIDVQAFSAYLKTAAPRIIDEARGLGLLDSGGAIASNFQEIIARVESDRKMNGMLNRDKAAAVFRKQLGDLWFGPEKLPPYMKGILACLLARVCGTGSKESAELSERMASVPQDERDFSFADAVIEKYRNHEYFREVTERHAYVYTVFAMLMQLSRTGANPGVFASAQFKWVRPIDRRLWYTLNNVGRHAFHVECAGIMAHWLAEKEIGLKMECPCIDNAVVMIEQVKVGKKTVESVIGGLEFALKEFCDADGKRIYQ